MEILHALVWSREYNRKKDRGHTTVSGAWRRHGDMRWHRQTGRRITEKVLGSTHQRKGA